MQWRIRSLAVTMAALFVMGGALTPQAARADIAIDVYISGALQGSQTVAGLTNTYNIGTINVGGTFDLGTQKWVGGTTFNGLTITATDNYPGGTTGDLAQVSITSGGSTGSGTLQVVVQETSPFTAPGGAGSPMVLQSNVSRADGSRPTTLTFQSWANGTVSGVSPFVTGGTTPGQQVFDGTKGSFGPPNQAFASFTNSGTYTLQSVLTLAAGDTSNINVNGSTTVSTPEPSSVALAGLGALGLIGYGVRRRKALAV